MREDRSPKIFVKDDSESIDLDDVFRENMVSSAETESVFIKGREFKLTHIKLRSNSSQSHIIAFCAAQRLVQEEQLKGKIDGLFGKLSDETGTFVYACYVTSSFLDDAVRPERTGFDIVNDVGELFADTELSWKELVDSILDRVSKHLAKHLEENYKKAKERIDKFVANKAPRYRPILSRIPENKLNIDPNISDRELDLTLHRYLSEIEEKLLVDGHEMMAPKENENLFEYQRRLQKYLLTVEDIKKSDLANYVSHRKVIIDMLEKAIQRGDDGGYAREDLIHNLIMPMRNDSNSVLPDSCNLWLVDERLAFHDYLASDKAISSMPISGSIDNKEPDIFALNVFDNPILVSEKSTLPLASIVVVEIKRPMRNDAAEGEDKDPIEQTLGYLDRIRRGTVTTHSGRPIPNSENIPGYCYAISDLAQSMKKRCKIHDAIRTSDGLGYFFYKKNFDAFVEVISFDRLVNSAKERNKAFFDKLGLPTT